MGGRRVYRMTVQLEECRKSHSLFRRSRIKKLKLSARSYYRILKVARTISDLENKENVEIEHLQEAIALNKLPILD